MEPDRPENHVLHMESTNVRYSNSPARKTQIQVHSPIKSIHPEQSAMASIHDQPDFGMRTTDFFDDDSDTEYGLPRAITTDTFEARSRSLSPAKRKRMPLSGQSFISKCEPKRVSMKALEPESEGYQRVDSNINREVPHPDSPGTESYAGSVDEFLPRASQEDGYLTKRAARESSTTRFRTSGLGWNTSTQAPDEDGAQHDHRVSSMYSDRIDQRLGVHQMAYELLINGMLNDEELMNSKRETLKEQRASTLPSALRIFDPRSPRDQLPANPSPERTSLHRGSQARKKAHFVPPPIEVGATRNSLPSDLVRTPYPHTARGAYNNSFTPSFSSIADEVHSQQMANSVLMLSVRRLNSNSILRMTTVTIPASNDYSAVLTNEKGTKEEHTSSHAFDDEQLFQLIRAAHKDLCSPLVRILSARSLSRITVSGTCTPGFPSSQYGTPDLRTSGRSDVECTWSEAEIMQMYQRPSTGRAKFTFVHWARRLSASTSAHHQQGPRDLEQSQQSRRSAKKGPNRQEGDENDEKTPTERYSLRFCGDEYSRTDRPAGLEFILSWSLARILTALLFVLLLSLAASLLWIFLGTQTNLSPGLVSGGGGYRGAGDRVETGVLLGLMALLVGVTGFGGWIGVSWMVL